ncbi:MAG: hypothetical protein IPM14_13120 [bacterium]|nr:hypothetical protein [bacterium]
MIEIKFAQYDNTVICFIKNILLNLSNIKSLTLEKTGVGVYGTDGRYTYLETKEDSSVTPIILSEGKKATS